MSLPNQLTILRIILSPVFLYFFYSTNKDLKFLSFIIFTIAAITDWYDGIIARKYGFETRWGKFLDPLADKILTSFAFIGFLTIGFIEFWMFLIIVIRDIGITLLRSFSELKGKTVITTYSAKVKTFIQMTAIFYILFFYCIKDYDFVNNHFGVIINDYILNPIFINILMIVITSLTLYTGIMYLIDNRKTIRDIYASSSQTS
ncbi:MAG TPA: CDP-diacylglycerol--glycerol-3-phosphate 3-phosphatidyltransferase [Bacteroidota bacterium]|jgi:CDP-diacylglycerol--glycerol-3-phosphate 3-phosphatidyltransferase|nr:CDP-diacylglycerol--glycerol-3-phosphate 3-phosphatidyltransferase [Bacteroidota bacterium]